MTLWKMTTVGVLAGIMLYAVQAFGAEAPKAAGLSATVEAKVATYLLDPAQSGQTFHDKIAKGAKQGEKLPPPPKVDLALVITNTGAKEATINIGGDESQLDLKLEGPGALVVANNIAMTMEFRYGKPITIKPGATLQIPITSLSGGTRGVGQLAYWTEPGDYLLSVTLIAAQGEGQVRIVSAPVKLKVELNR